MVDVNLEAELVRAIHTVANANYPMALVGAGMSVESGIPPFRGPGGLWTKYGEPPMDGYQRFLADPHKWWMERLNEDGPSAEFHETFAQAEPNPGHVALADLESLGFMNCIITQNVDNLHQRAGSSKVAEIHGNMTKMRCVGCRTRWHQDEFRIDDYPPMCPHCGGLVKDDTVMFGEPIPLDVLARCQTETEKCDCMLLIGTTAEVYPAAGFPLEVKASGGFLIEINPYDTVISGRCDVVLRSPSGEVLPRIVDGVQAAKGS